MSQNDYHIQYTLSGQSFKYKTTSGFLAEKMMRNVMSFAEMNKMPLWKTKLRLIVSRKHYQQYCFTMSKMKDGMFVTNLYYN